ncbi:hypothetical protein BWI93_00370 [Siphonobacter sp. BAB-5385]|nr:hypothetical protein BWI93_00370 [Siphonobacter sp. BAB-5385]
MNGRDICIPSEYPADGLRVRIIAGKFIEESRKTDKKNKIPKSQRVIFTRGEACCIMFEWNYVIKK